jgi:PAS domain-containing protein
MNSQQIESAAEQVAEKLVAYRTEIHKLKAVLQLCPVPIAIVHTDGKTLLYINPAYTFFFGLTAEQITEFWSDPWMPEDRPKLKAYWEEVCSHLNLNSTLARYTYPPTGEVKVARITSTVLAGNGIIVYSFPEKCWDIALPRQIISPQEVR